MATTLIPSRPTPEPEEPPSSDSTGNRPPGDRGDRDRGPDNGGGPGSERWSTPLSAYRAGMLFAMTSMVSLFVAFTVALQARWAHPADWVSIRLPAVLYLNTLVLLISSVTIEVARLSARAEARRRRSVCLGATLLLGFAFVGGQLVGWKDLVSNGVYLASNPGSLFLYVITGVHGLHLLGGMIALIWVIFRTGSLERSRKAQTAVDVVALYWHFMDGLWVYLLGLLLLRVQR